MTNIQIVQGDITQAKVDAIVNAANPIMLGGGGVDGAIHRAAGPKLLEACHRIKAVDGIRCPVGEARLTPAGNLSAKHVIHTVGPRYRRDENPALLLASAYRTSLDLALENGCESIAFPAISCGAYGYPLDDAAVIALATCNGHKYDELAIFFYLLGDEAIAAWETALKRLPPNKPVGELTWIAGGKVDRSSVTLRFWGDDLVPDEITRQLGIEPTDACQKGNIFRGKVSDRIRKTGMWRYITEKSTKLSLEELIERIFSQATQDLEVWQCLTEQFDADLFCGLWCDRWNREVDLSPQILGQVSERGLQLSLDIYFDGDDEGIYPEAIHKLSEKAQS